jgi:hypothetical protein
MEWNEEPMGPGLPQWMRSIPGAMRQGGELLSQGVRALQTPAPQEDVKALQRQLITERARQQYEQRFGQSPVGVMGARSPSMAAQGQAGNVDMLLRRISAARRGG